MVRKIFLLIQREQFFIKKNGFSLVEIIIATALISLYVVSLLTALIYFNKLEPYLGRRTRAIFLAEEGLEMVRNIRDDSFENLIDGTHGLSIVNGEWVLGEDDDTSHIFKREIVISSINENSKMIESIIIWPENRERLSKIYLFSRLNNWQRLVQTTCQDQANYLLIDAENVRLEGNNVVTGLQLQNQADDCEIIIDKISVSWTSPGRRLNRIEIDGSTVWSGNVSSGQINEIDNIVLFSNQDPVENIYHFSGNIRNNTFSFSYFMLDGTVKTISDINP